VKHKKQLILSCLLAISLHTPEVPSILLLLFLPLFLLTVALRYSVAFTKVLSLYHSWIHPLHHSPLSCILPFLESFNRSHCSIFIHEYIIFLPYSPSYTLSLSSPFHRYQPPDRTYFPFLFSTFEKKEFHCDISVYTYYNLSWLIPSVFIKGIGNDYYYGNGNLTILCLLCWWVGM
jgi:hypothetical protein